MIPFIEEFMMDNWNRFFDHKPEKLQFLLLSNPQGKRSDRSKCTVLVFVDHGQIPSIVCKFMRAGSIAPVRLVNETKIQTELLKYKIAPKSILSQMINGRLVIFEEYLRGSTLKSDFIKQVNKFSLKNKTDVLALIERDFSEVALLLNKMSKFVIAEYNSGGSEPNYFENALSMKEEVFSFLELNDGLTRTINEVVNKYLDTSSNEKKFVHLDLTPNNIFRFETQLYLIDFEFSDVSIHSFLDPMRFLFYYFHICHENDMLPSVSYEENFCHFFFGDNEFSELVRLFINDVSFNRSTCLSLEEYLILFVIGNFHLQLSEVKYIGSDQRQHTYNILRILVGLLNGEGKANFEHFETNLENRGLREASDITQELLKKELQEKNRYIEECHRALQEKEGQLEENKIYINKCHRVIEEKDAQLKENISYIEKCHRTIEDKDAQLERNVEYIARCHKTIEEKEACLVESRGVIEEFQKTTRKTDKEIFSKAVRRLKQKFKKR